MPVQKHAAQVLAMLDTGAWRLSRNIENPGMTDDYNTRTAWSVERNTAPFCDSKSIRIWFGPTAYEALQAAYTALFGAYWGATYDGATEEVLLNTQLGFFFSVGQSASLTDAEVAQRQSRSYSNLRAIFYQRGAAELSALAPSDMMPITVKPCEWTPKPSNGMAIQSIWFESSSEITPAAAAKLLELTTSAYTAACGNDATFVSADELCSVVQQTRRQYHFNQNKPHDDR